MIYTARQLQDLLRNGDRRIVLPYRARLTPLAQDWIRAKKVQLGYGDVPGATDGNNGSAGTASSAAASQDTSNNTAAFLWWCDGPCGPAKAALVSEERQSSLRPLDAPSDSKRIVQVVKQIAQEVKTGRAAGAVLMVQSGAQAIVYANRCSSLRAVLGTCLETVEQGVQHVGANVLVLEYPHRTLQQMKNMLSRFVRANRSLSDDVKQQLQELASCG